MMLSRCNYHAVTLVNARLNSLGFYRPFFAVSCVAKTYHRRLEPRCCYSHSHDEQKSERNPRLSSSRLYTSRGQPPSMMQSTPPPSINGDDDDKSQSIFQRFKNMAKKYWYIVLPVHLVTSTLWFGSFYFIASSGIDVPALLESLRIPDWIIDKVRNGNSWTSYLVIAYGLYKICTPLRYMVTLGGTSMTIRYLRTLGYTMGNSANSPKKP